MLVTVSCILELLIVYAINFVQMIGCRTRGFSFTRALLGLAANELHLCGDAAAVPLVQEILKVTGDTIKVLTFSSLVFKQKVVCI